MTAAPIRCRWCGRAFERRGGGGKVQHFCRQGYRRALDAAGRRYVAEALAVGLLTVADLETGPIATRALTTAVVVPFQVPGTAGELLSDVLDALPEPAWQTLPDEILGRIGAWLEEGDEISRRPGKTGTQPIPAQ